MKLARRFAVAAVGASTGIAGLAAASIAVAPAAHAARTTTVAQATCKAAKGIANSKPGLTGTQKAATITGTISASGCTGVKGSTSGSGSFVLHATKLSCTQGSATGSLKFKTNNGKTATATLKLATTPTPLIYTITGKVTGGSFGSGSIISGKFKAAPIKGNCFTSPLTKASVTNQGSFKL